MHLDQDNPQDHSRLGMKDGRQLYQGGFRVPGSEEGLQERWGGLFIMNCSVRTGDNGFKLEESRFRLAVGKKTFIMSVIKILAW